MAIEDPGSLPRWASSPPAAPPTAVTEPAETLKDSGFVPGQGYREYFNWLFRQNYLWIRFVSFVRTRWQDFGSDFDVPDQGTLPATTVGTLVGVSGTTVSYINGRRVEGVSEAHTYPVTSDTYVDLTQDAVWVYVPVGLGAAAPAITANSRRQWKVVTNGTQITSVTDLREDRVKTSKRWSFRKTIDLGADLLGSVANALIARISIPFSGTYGKTTLFESMRGNGTGSGLQLLRTIATYRNEDSAEVVLNATWDGTNWTRTRTAYPAVKVETGTSAGLVIVARAGASANTWTDAEGAAGWDVTQLVLDVMNSSFASHGLTSLAKTGYYSFGGTEFTTKYLGGSYGFGGGTDPDALRFDVSSDAATANAYFIIPLHLPHGSIITAVRLQMWKSGGNGETRVALVRAPLFGATTPTITLKTGTAYDLVPDVAGTYQTVDMTINETLAMRTVDNSAYLYAFWFMDTSTNDTATLDSGRVTYTITPYAI